MVKNRISFLNWLIHQDAAHRDKALVVERETLSVCSGDITRHSHARSSDEALPHLL